MSKLSSPSVIFVTYFFFPEVAAASVRAKAFAEAFEKKGVAVDVVVSSRLKRRFSFRTSSTRYSPNVDIYRFDSFRIGFLIDPLVSLSFFVRCLAIGLLRKPNVVMASVPPAETAVIAWFVAKLIRVPIIIDVRDVISPKAYELKRINRFLFIILKYTYRHADTVASVTDGLSAHLQYLGVERDNIKSARNGADTKIFHPVSSEEFERIRHDLNIPLEEFVLVFVADLNDNRHRLDIILKSLKLLKDTNDEVSLIVIGDGILRKHFEKFAEMLKLRKTRFLGKLEGSALARHIISADVGLVSYSNDEEVYLPIFPTKAYEYLACGKPVIAAMPVESELARFLRNNNLGLSVEPENVAALSSSILQVKRQRNYSSRVRENAMQILSFLDRRNQAENFADFVVERYVVQRARYR